MTPKIRHAFHTVYIHLFILYPFITWKALSNSQQKTTKNTMTNYDYDAKIASQVRSLESRASSHRSLFSRCTSPQVHLANSQAGSPTAGSSIKHGQFLTHAPGRQADLAAATDGNLRVTQMPTLNLTNLCNDIRYNRLVYHTLLCIYQHYYCKSKCCK